MHRQWKRASLAAGLLCAMFLLPATALAQDGAIAGTVRDATGAVLPGVTVEVRSPALIGARTTVSGANGRYSIIALPVGTYEVRFTLPSFNQAVREGIAITTGFTATVNAELRPGDISEEVTVVGEAPTVDVTQARQTTVLTGEDLRDLPTSRNLSSLMVLVPGLNYQTGAFNQAGGICVGGAGTWCTPNVSGFNAHGPGDGEDRAQGQLRVDGMVLNSASGTVMGNMSGYIVDVANAQEVSFNLTGALGESETGGASINIVPRTGGNTYRGSYSTTYTSNRWFDKNNDTRGLNLVNNIVSDHDVSGAFGGPILRDRLWFYSVLRTQGKEAYPGGNVFYYNKNAGIWGANYVPDRERGRLTYTNQWRNANARITLQASPRNKFNLFWDEQEACQDPCGGAVSSTWSPEANWSVRVYPNRVRQLSWTNPFTNTVLLEGGLNVVTQHYDFTRHKYETMYPEVPQISEVHVGGCCIGRDDVALQVHPGSPFGGSHPQGGGCLFTSFCSGSINQGNLDRIGNARPRLSASYITGSHNAKIGWEAQYFWERSNVHTNGPQLMYGLTSPPAGCETAAPLEDYPCGRSHPMYADPSHPNFDAANFDPYNLLRRPVPVMFAQNAGMRNFDERLTTHALYVQDQWTVNRFTLNGALRYDHATSRYDPTCLNANVFITEAQAWCTEANDGVSFHDITPRWGVAWDVFGDGRTAVKWNMGKYLSAARFTGVYTDSNLGRNSTFTMGRDWDDLNGNRIIDCDLRDPAAQDLSAAGGDTCGSENPANFARFGASPTVAFGGTFFCGQEGVKGEIPNTEWGTDYCAVADQNLYEGWDSRRNEWQLGIGVQREILPRLSAEVTYNQRWFGNLQTTDSIGVGCDLYSAGREQCLAGMMNFQAPIDPEQDMAQYSFYRVQAPVDPRLPNGGGYWVRGLDTRGTFQPLPGGRNVATFQSYTRGWRGVDTNFVLRARGGLRLNGGTSTGGTFEDTCSIMEDGPDVRAREGREPACRQNAPFQTNVRGSVSYTIPWVDVLASAVFQSRPGPSISANVTYRRTPAVAGSQDVIVWEEGSEWRATHSGTPCTNNVNSPLHTGCFFGSNAQTQSVNVLDTGDMYGSRYNMVDLKLAKNIRFARRRINLGVDIYNLFNSDAIVSYNGTYNPQTWTDEHGNQHFDNPWRRAQTLIAPRFARFAVQFDF